MRIHVYGCSWSAGQPHINNFDSWPRHLALLEPKWKIYNFSYCGSSIHFSSAMLMQLSKKINEPVYHIFQGTSPYRWTHFTKSIDPMDYLIQQTSNYFSFYPRDNYMDFANIFQPKKDVTQINFRRYLPSKDVVSLYKKKLKHQSSVEWELEYSSIFEAIRNNFNLAFFHKIKDYKIYQQYYNNKVMCTQEILSDLMWNKFIADKGDHFGVKGLQWQASFIRDYITKDK